MSVETANGLAVERHEFHLVSLATAMDMHNGADVSRSQTLIREIDSQDDAVMHSDFGSHFIRSAGFTGHRPWWF